MPRPVLSLAIVPMNHASYHAGQFLRACLALITPTDPTCSLPPYLLACYDDLCLWCQLPFTPSLDSASYARPDPRTHRSDHRGGEKRETQRSLPLSRFSVCFHSRVCCHFVTNDNERESFVAMHEMSRRKDLY